MTEVLYGVRQAAYGFTTSNLYTIDPTGVASPTSIGATGAVDALGFAAAFMGIAIHPATGVMYGVAGDSDPNLVTINTTTGAATTVGPLTGRTNTLDIDFSAAGVLYTIEQTSGDFLRINLSTGATTFIGNTGLGFTGGEGIVIDQTGTCWVSDGTGGTFHLYTINLSTGAATQQSAITTGGLANAAKVIDTSSCRASTGDVWAALEKTTSGDYAITVNTATGDCSNNTGAKLAVSAGGSATALAWTPPATTPGPTLRGRWRVTDP